jgi:hypothetical protein
MNESKQLENGMNYDAILVISFGGPEKPADVMPFLENVLRGKNVPRERMLAVAEHYYHFGGKSPINDQNRQFIAALNAELIQYGPRLPIYWGNRNWHPMLADTLRQMKADGVSRALAFVTSRTRKLPWVMAHPSSTKSAYSTIIPDLLQPSPIACGKRSTSFHRIGATRLT